MFRFHLPISPLKVKNAFRKKLFQQKRKMFNTLKCSEVSSSSPSSKFIFYFSHINYSGLIRGKSNFENCSNMAWPGIRPL